MEPWLQLLLTIGGSVIASSGFWAFIIARKEKRDAQKNKTDPHSRMLLGLGHDRIIFLCMHYIDRGWITDDEYGDLKKYLYKPYTEMGGNGTAERLMSEVDKLPIHHITYVQQAQQNNQNPGGLP